MNIVQMSRRSLYDIFKQCTLRKIDSKLAFLEDKVKKLTKCPPWEFGTVNQDLRYFKTELKKRWASSNYMEERFMKKHNDWLNTSIPLHSWAPVGKQGRPSKEFQELSDCSKRRQTSRVRAC